jgi:hypothetical protein
MKKINLIIGTVLFFFLIGLSSCESYLDKKEDETMTFEKIWMKRTTILQYLDNVYGYILKDDDIEDGHPFIGAADDVDLNYPARAYNNINLGTWSASSVPYVANLWPQFYKGIREATVFIQNVDKSTAENVTSAEIERWKAEARFARAYQYFLLFRTYGPFIITGDDPVDISGNLGKARSPLDECVTYIESELTACSNILPERFTTNETSEYGRPTKGACLALIGRMKLYAARDLYNGNPLYVDIKNPDGANLFPTTRDANKWKVAADANKALITYSESNSLYQLYKDGTGTNPYLNYQNLFLTDWNSELIFARYNTRYDLQVLLTPAIVGGTCYGASGPTQGQVDAYAMANGKYPITGYATGGVPIIDAASGYSETGTASYTHPIEGNTAVTRRMYINREPRFYVSVLWSSAVWPYRAGGDKIPVFAYRGNSYTTASKTGYLTRKFVNPSANSAGGVWSSITFPVIRLAEIYLNYVEALNECEPGNSDIHKYLNLIRERAGVGNIQAVYPEVATLGTGTQARMRELIRKERQIELFFECHRYFDIRQWMIAETVDNGPMYGMNIMADASANVSVTPETFWQRTVAETRIFKPSYYLYPIRETEITRNSQLVQNYGWQ